jgi:hypothetical protein
VKTNFDNYTHSVEAILINPRWNTTDTKPDKPDGSITVEDFKSLTFSNKLMIDGLVFVWVEKEIILPIIKIMEK